MSFKTAAVFALCCAFVLAQDTNNNISSVPIQPAKSSTPPPTSTTSPNTTATPVTTPTTATTKRPTSSPPSTVEPITTLAPQIKGHYIVEDGNEICLMADFDIKVNLSIGNKSWEFGVPYDALTNDSVCNNETQKLVLSWEESEPELEPGKCVLSFLFVKSDTKFMVSHINLIIPHNSTLNLTNDKPEFTTSISKSYLCDKQQEIKLSEEGTNATYAETNATYAVLKMSHVQLQPFRTSKDEKFAAAEDCSSSSPDIVPIAVGCALVGLIAIVLIAYLVGRRRSQARGYLSM